VNLGAWGRLRPLQRPRRACKCLEKVGSPRMQRIAFKWNDPGHKRHHAPLFAWRPFVRTASGNAIKFMTWMKSEAEGHQKKGKRRRPRSRGRTRFAKFRKTSNVGVVVGCWLWEGKGGKGFWGLRLDHSCTYIHNLVCAKCAKFCVHYLGKWLYLNKIKNRFLLADKIIPKDLHKA
jgi:hypothetical protein